MNEIVEMLRIEVEEGWDVSVRRRAADEIDRLESELAAEKGKNHLLRIQIGNAEVARKDYEDGWRQGQTELTVLNRELEAARAEVERFTRERDEMAEKVVKAGEAANWYYHQAGEAQMDLAAVQEAARPRQRPDREALRRAVWDARAAAQRRFSGIDEQPGYEAANDVQRETCGMIADAVADALDAAPVPLATGTGRPAAAGWYWLEPSVLPGPSWHDGKREFDGRWAGPLPAPPWEGRDDG